MAVAYYYETANGRRPVEEFISEQSSIDRAAILGDLAFLEIRWPKIGMPQVRYLGECGLWELRVFGRRRIFRVFFCVEGNVLYLLHAFVKKTQKTPRNEISTACARKRILGGIIDE